MLVKYYRCGIYENGNNQYFVVYKELGYYIDYESDIDVKEIIDYGWPNFDNDEQFMMNNDLYSGIVEVSDE